MGRTGNAAFPAADVHHLASIFFQVNALDTDMRDISAVFALSLG